MKVVPQSISKIKSNTFAKEIKVRKGKRTNMRGEEINYCGPT